jgi:hypothetical protein
MVLAIMMHATAKTDRELKKIKLHPSFDEKVFLQDLIYTQDLWLPPLFVTAVVQLRCLHQIVTDEAQLGGVTQDERLQMLEKHCEDHGNDQLKEVLEMLIRIETQLVDKEVEPEQTIDIDPFYTENYLYVDDKDLAKAAG